MADAKAAAQRVCSQLLMLNGTLDLSNKMLGKRTADVSNVAFNRTLSAGVSVKKVGGCGACAHACITIAHAIQVCNLTHTEQMRLCVNIRIALCCRAWPTGRCLYAVGLMTGCCKMWHAVESLA